MHVFFHDIAALQFVWGARFEFHDLGVCWDFDWVMRCSEKFV